MRVKTSITISKETLKTIDEICGQKVSLSEFIETAVRVYLTQFVRNKQYAGDLEIINRHADDLNEEANDVLEYQMNL